MINNLPLDLTTKGTTKDQRDVQYDDVTTEENNVDTEEMDENSTRSIKWIYSNRVYTPPESIWDKVYDRNSNTINSVKYTYYKNKICADFDTQFECILVLKKPRIGVKWITVQGHCKHDNCRKIKLLAPATFNGSPSFSVYYSTLTVNHITSKTRQYRGILRDEAKDKLKNALPATYVRGMVSEMDEQMYKVHKKRTVPTDAVAQKIRSELMMSQDNSKDDFLDIVELQKATKSSPYIKKVISPYAVYIHSKEQYDTLLLMHRRKKPGEEVVGRLDATGNVAYVTPETSEHPLMYYPLVCSIKLDDADRHHTLFPITECINTKHGTTDITAWLQDFNESFIANNPHIMPVLDRVISDFSFANFHGVLHSFQSMRLQEYIYICYRYAVNLEDFSRLSKLVKLQMCATHLSKTKTSFVQRHFPSDTSSKKTCFEQKFVTEVLFSLMSCKAYNLIKEIFRNLCVMLVNQFRTEEVEVAKKAIATLTERNMLMKERDEFNLNCKFNVIAKEKINELSEDESVYGNISILQLPIYRGSQFYVDLKHIFDCTMTDAEAIVKDIDKLEKNSFYKPTMLDEYMKQFGGLLPLWTGITVPESVERYDNQPAERQMLVAKDLLDEMALQIGHTKVRVTRFLKLLREVTIANAKRYRLKLGKNTRSNRIGKNKPKDNSKVAKKIIAHIKAKASKSMKMNTSNQSMETSHQSAANYSLQSMETSTASSNYSLRSRSHEVSQSTKSSKAEASKKRKQSMETSHQSAANYSLQSMEISTASSNYSLRSRSQGVSTKSSKRTNESLQSSSNSSSSSIRQSIGGAKECWRKNKAKKPRFSYHKRSTIIAVNDGYEPRRRKDNKANKKKSAKKGKALNQQTVTTTTTGKASNQQTVATTTTTFPNGLKKDVKFYQQLVPSNFVVARIGDCKLFNEDYNTLKAGNDLSSNAMAYILTYILPARFVNLLSISREIITELRFETFNITNRVCLLPMCIESEWHCIVIDCNKSTYQLFTCSSRSTLECEKKLTHFVKTYNLDVKHRKKLEPIEFWKEISVVKGQHPSVESGMFIVHLLNLFVNEQQLTSEFDVAKLRQDLMTEVLLHSDNTFDVCVVCGDTNDLTNDSVIHWTNCVRCDRWIHNNCITMTASSASDYSCVLCQEYYLEKELSSIQC